MRNFEKARTLLRQFEGESYVHGFGALAATGRVADAGIQALAGRELGEAVARALNSFEPEVGVPSTLNEVKGFGPAHIALALAAAKDPPLRMKLDSMLVPLAAEMADEYMGSVLAAAATGELAGIRNVQPVLR
jgi:alcohol dehydrogenase